MRDKTQPWERLPAEPNLWWIRFESFRAAGPTRSLRSVYNRERVSKGLKELHSPAQSWRAAAETFRWFKRAEAWDVFITAEATRRMEAERLEVLQEGFALDHLRVQALKTLALALEEHLQDPNKVWLPDVKSIGQGDAAERVDIVRFNEGLIEQFRGSLADIADEVGGRQKQNRNLNIDMSTLTIAQLERIAHGEDPIKVLATASR